MKELLSPAALELAIMDRRVYTAGQLWVHVISTAAVVKGLEQKGTPPRRKLGKQAKAERCCIGLRKWASLVRHAT